MRINEIDKLIQRCQGQQPLTSARKLVQDFEQTCAKINREKALQAAESQLQQDQLLCDVMFVLQKVSALTTLAKQCMARTRSPEAAKALIIARHALEVAADGLTMEYRPFTIRRV